MCVCVSSSLEASPAEGLSLAGSFLFPSLPLGRALPTPTPPPPPDKISGPGHQLGEERRKRDPASADRAGRLPFRPKWALPGVLFLSMWSAFTGRQWRAARPATPQGRSRPRCREEETELGAVRSLARGCRAVRARAPFWLWEGRLSPQTSPREYARTGKLPPQLFLPRQAQPGVPLQTRPQLDPGGRGADGGELLTQAGRAWTLGVNYSSVTPCGPRWCYPTPGWQDGAAGRVKGLSVESARCVPGRLVGARPVPTVSFLRFNR